MALVIADRVRETTTTTGTGTITLGGAVANFETFSANLSDGDTTYYAIVDGVSNTFEVGLGTFTASGTTLARTTIIASSNSNNAVDLAAGTKDVFITIPANKMIVKDASGNVSIDGDVTIADGSNDFDVASHDGTNGLKLGGTLVTSSAAELNILDGKSFVDEDNMASNSATAIPSQQSVKAYVDTQITAEDLDFQADSGGALSIDLDSETLTFTGGTGIDTSGSGNAVTFAIDSTVATLADTQTFTNKTLTSPKINENVAVSATATEINIMDRHVCHINNISRCRQSCGERCRYYAQGSDFETYFESALDTLSNVTTVGALNSGSITSGFGAIDNGSSAITTTGTVTYGSLSDGSITITAFVDEDDMTSNSATLVPTQQSVKAYVDAQITAEDLDVTTDSGTIDIDLDSETLTIAGGTGLSSSASSTTVTMAVDAAQTGITSVVNTSLEIGRDADNRIKFGTDNQIIFEVDGGDNVIFKSSGEIEATSLDISGDADIDGTLEADAITVNGTALGTVIAGTTVTNATNATNATLASTVTVSDSTANTNFPVVFHDESNGLLDDTGALRYNPSTGELLVPNLTVAGTTTTVDTVTMNAQNAVVFEGATADANETTLTITDPTADRTITLPDTTGTVSLVGATETLTNKTLTTPVIAEIDSGSTITLDATTDIILDADGGDIFLKDDGTTFGEFTNSSTDFVIKSTTSDKDIIFKGNDGGSEITALTLDMSAAGDATFNSNLTIEGGVINVKNTGTQSEVRLYCESSNAHYAALKAPAHADFSGNITLTLPATTGTLISTANSDAPTTTTSSSDADFVLVDDGGVMKKITPANLGIGGGSGSITVQDEGSALSTEATTLNFVGAGVTASGTGATKTITISGGGGSGGAFTDQTWGASLDSDSANESKLFLKNAYGNIIIGSDNSVTEPTSVLDETGNAYDNIIIGRNAGTLATEAHANIFIGTNAGDNITTGDRNIFIGYQAGDVVETSHSRSTFIGFQAGYDADGTGDENIVAIGYQSGYRARNSNVSVGNYVGSQRYYTAYGLYRSVSVGHAAGGNYYNYGRSYDVDVGYNAGVTNRQGDYSTHIGYISDSLSTSVSYGVSIGAGAKTAASSVSIGFDSQQSGNSGSTNLVTIGYRAGYDMDGGDYSIYVGYQAGYSGGSGSYNIAVGSDALYDIDAGAGNVAMGHEALNDVTSGNYNTAIGYQAGASNTTTGDYNVFIGYAAKNDSGGASDNGIAIGKSAETFTGGVSIGYEAMGGVVALRFTVLL